MGMRPGQSADRSGPPPWHANPADRRARSEIAVNGNDVVLALLLALLSTSLAYRFGTGNQLEQIPLILRQLDPSYLVNDYFVSTSVEFGPRVYFAKLLAGVCQVLPLPWAYGAFTFLSDLALIAVTQWAARSIVGADRLGGAIASVLALGVSSFHLGDATQIRYEVFQPASLAIPGALWAVGLGLRGRPILAAVVASISSLPHPLYGVQAGAIALGTAFFVLLLAPKDRGASVNERQGRPTSLAWRSALGKTAVGAAVLGASIAVFWWLPYRAVNAGAVLSDAEFFEILARFRSPHHYLPSHFRPADYITAGLFVVATGLALERWSRRVSPRAAVLFLLPMLAALAGCLAGTAFTELWPIRAVVTLQPFRLLSILKWMGYLLFGWLLASYWQRPPNALARPLVAASLLSTGGTHPLVTAASLFLIRLQDSRWFRVSQKITIAVMVVAAGFLWLMFGSRKEGIYLVTALGLVVAFSQVRRTLKAAATLVATTFVLGLALNREGAGDVDLPSVVPVYSLADHRDMRAETARAAAKHTPPDAVFVTPPAFGVLRIIGERALVVDFKLLPLQDEGMREWRDRIRVVYGEVQGGGFTALHALEQAYRATTDVHLRELRDRYGATHAVLYSDTPTAMPVLYVNDSYRIVALSSR